MSKEQKENLIKLESNYKKNKENKKEDVLGFNGKDSPEENAFFLSILSWDWLNRFIWFCFRNVLEDKHLFNIASYDRSERLCAKIKVEWEKELLKPNPSYTRAGFRAFGPTYLIASLFYVVFIASQVVGPELLSRMVIFILDLKSGKEGIDANWGYYYALIIFCTSMVGSICLYQSNMITARVGDYMRSVIVCNVYEKSLRLSNSARANTSTGEIVNLMSNDAQRMIEVFALFNNGFFAPLQILICVVLLYLKIKWITFVALAFMILSIPVHTLLGKKLVEVRRFFVKFTDKRVKATNELLQSMKIVKLYSWEDSLAKRVLDHRSNEIKYLFKYNYIRTILVTAVQSLPSIISILVFSIYFKVSDDFEAGNIFAAMSYLNILKVPLAFLPFLIALLGQLQVATKRVTDFLLLPEIDPVQEPDDPNTPNGIYIEGADLVWNKEDSDSFGLHNINIHSSGPSLMMIVGSVGSGKSSLCQAMLGELSVKSGKLAVKGRISYAAQQAWIINASLRENILFGKPMDFLRYQQVIECCALQKDIDMFPQGDMVEIGERGINLSGGQKQRVSIARAVYNEADIYIFDDPLSAVDAHVGKHLFHQCINGILKEKNVILSTNQLQYLPYATDILVMSGGYISERGTYRNIIESKGEFSKQIIEYGIEDDIDSNTQSTTFTPTSSSPQIIESTSNVTINDSKDGTLISKEDREEGSVSIRVYFQYFTAGGLIRFMLVVFFYMADTGSNIFLNWWLSYWADAQEEISKTGRYNNLTNQQFLYYFIGIGFASILILGCRTISFYTYCVKVGKVLHNRLFNSIISAPMWFFDTTPIGRIINRFTRDTDSVDNLISSALGNYIINLFGVLGTVLIISIIIPKLLIVLVPVAVLFYLLQTFYRHTSRELQRLVAISQSPIFNHFNETLSGVVSIRAYKLMEENKQTNMRLLDSNNVKYLTLQAAMQWLGLRLDLLANLIIFFSFIFVYLARDSIELGAVGLALSYSLTLTQCINKATILAADTETKMNSVERILHYINGPKEAPQIIENNRPSQSWPQQGGIIFNNLVMRYREGLDPVLKGVSCEIKPKEKVGIVGRTGAGKSSIVLALFRLVEASEGSIFIDGQDISLMGLKDLRRNLSIIPQEPVLFTGTLRENLDPFEEHTDAELWDILETIQLDNVVRGNEGELYCKVTEDASNWSVGQRQLICLGRALMKKPKILVLDEATASVDSKTDQLIQLTIRSKFSDCTILTIAHRLNTIMDSDRILVLDSGQVSEFDTPHNLLQNPDGLLSWLTQETGENNAKLLRKIAYHGKYMVSNEENHDNIIIEDIDDTNQN